MLAVVVPATSVAAATDKLPDLQMAKLRGFRIENTTDGRRLFRFTAIIVNSGVGAFEARGSRPNTSTSEMTVSQRIFDTAGGSRDVATAARMYYAGDGHNHWHLRNLETYELDRLDNGVKVGTGAKMGFCFYDNYQYKLALPGAPQSAVYLNCGGKQPQALTVATGLSIGWGDKYGAGLPDQYIDITGLGAGKYRLRATADEANWFLEGNETNNVTWVDLQLTGSGYTILSYGPYAQ